MGKYSGGQHIGSALYVCVCVCVQCSSTSHWPGSGVQGGHLSEQGQAVLLLPSPVLALTAGEEDVAAGVTQVLVGLTPVALAAEM